MQSREAMMRFLQHVGKYFMYSAGYGHQYKWGARDADLLRKARFIQLPKERLPYINLDLDWPGSARVWIDEGFPSPTIVVISPRTSHSLLMWELAIPVTIPNVHFTGVANLKPYKYFNAVRAGFNKSLGGDAAFSGHCIKNPFYANLKNEILQTGNGIILDQWKTHWIDVTYSLTELAEYVELENRRYKPEKLFDPSSRLKSMFNYAAHDAYSAVHHCKTLEEFKAKATEIVMGYYHQFKQIEKNHPLEKAEAERVIRSIVPYVWQRRDKKWMKKFKYNIGAMKLEPIDYSALNSTEVDDEITKRQSLAARYTHTIRRNATEQKIKSACLHLLQNGERLTYKNVAESASVSISTVKRYKEILKIYN